MPINLVGNTCFSNEKGNILDTSSIAQQPYLSCNYIESNIEEKIDRKNQFRIKHLPCPSENTYVHCKSHMDSSLNDPSTSRNTEGIDFKDKIFGNIFLTTHFYVDIAIYQPPLVRINKKKFLTNSLTNISHTTINSETTDDNHAVIKACVDSSSGNSKNRRDLSTLFNDQDIFSEKNKLLNLDSITINRSPTSDKDLANKNYVVDDLYKQNHSQSLFNVTKFDEGDFSKLSL